MTGCVVCDQDEGYCEFCPPEPDNPDFPFRDTSWDDPGDENDNVVSLNGRYSPDTFVARITNRSYKASYQIADTFFVRTIVAPDSFLDAVQFAEGLREEGETLINVTELT